MSSNDDQIDNQTAEQPQAPNGDSVAIEKIEGGAVAIGCGARAVYQGLSYEEVVALFGEIKNDVQPTVWDGRKMPQVNRILPPVSFYGFHRQPDKLKEPNLLVNLTRLKRCLVYLDLAY